SRDYLQLYVLSFLQMTAATVINTDLTYGALFLAYVVFSTWTLILFHLRREMEQNFLLKYTDGQADGRPVQVERVLNSRKLVGAGFLGVTSVVSLVVFAGAVVLFFAFPRVGFGFFFKKQRAGITMAGFSDQVELGHFGLIKDDPTVVMRVEYPDGGKDRLAPYWRGIAFDHYDGVRWTKSRKRPQCRVFPDDDGRHVLEGRMRVTGERCIFFPKAQPPTGPQVRQKIYLEPMDNQVLFGQPDLRALQLPANLLGRFGREAAIAVDLLGDVHYKQFNELAFQYEAFSQPEPVTPEMLALDLPTYRARLPRYIQRLYLQLPEDLSPQIRQLAQRLTADAQTLGEAVDAVQRHLRTEYAYTLDLGRDARYAPLDDFLFVQRRGHCEYFATAFVILLRAAGIPARNVNGFLGGTWNDYGGYLAVSQGNAHSWAEIYAGDHRWQTRDPTPSAPGQAGGGAGLLSKLRLYADALRLRWYKYVVEFDLKDQASALKGVRDAWRRTFGGDRTDWRSLTQAVLKALGLAVALGLLAFVIRNLRWRRIGQHSAARQAAVADLFERLLARYEGLGFRRDPAQTPREFIDRLAADGAPDPAIAQAVLATYEAVRYQGEPVDGAALLDLRRQIRHIGRASKPA
ncbi:MAG: DUF3488 domain-containing protein, partial [Myxococcales bacterium]|nr:DUF3488 domain-containing protein [Myxococcales bacterium]